MSDTKRKTHCWKDHREHLEETEGYSEAWAATYVNGNGTCMLERGHEGPHVFTPDADITVAFVDPRSTGGGG